MRIGQLMIDLRMIELNDWKKRGLAENFVRRCVFHGLLVPRWIDPPVANAETTFRAIGNAYLPFGRRVHRIADSLHSLIAKVVCAFRVGHRRQGVGRLPFGSNRPIRAPTFLHFELIDSSFGKDCHDFATTNC
jgi:hypothetical protein